MEHSSRQAVVLKLYVSRLDLNYYLVYTLSTFTKPKCHATSNLPKGFCFTSKSLRYSAVRVFPDTELNFPVGLPSPPPPSSLSWVLLRFTTKPRLGGTGLFISTRAGLRYSKNWSPVRNDQATCLFPIFVCSLTLHVYRRHYKPL